jgi:hypothetical protein
MHIAHPPENAEANHEARNEAAEAAALPTYRGKIQNSKIKPNFFSRLPTSAPG